MNTKSLIIGDTAQLSYYFPITYDRISSRNIDHKFIIERNYDNVYILFGEQRTFLNESDDFFIDVNVNKTLKLINEIKDHVKRIVVYSTSELWNNYETQVFVCNKYNYNYTPYIKSKEILCNLINENRHNYQNVFIVYPFNFNSPYRKSGFLFSKIFESITKKNINKIGDINFERDLIHPSIIVRESINTKSDILVGTGSLINIENFVSDLFNVHNMNYKDYLINEIKNNLPNKRGSYYSGIGYSSYHELLTLTIKDVYEYKIS